jgi:hypothetical protein
LSRPSLRAGHTWRCTRRNHPTASVSFADLQRVVGFPEYWSRETLYQAKE